MQILNVFTIGLVPAAAGDTTAVSTVLEFLARNWALMSIAVTVTLLIIVPLAVLMKYAHTAVNLMDDVAPPLKPESREIGPRDGEDVVLAAFDGHTLHGSYLPADSSMPRKGAVIFAHEFGVDRRSYFLYGRPLRQAGYDVFAFDFRGHGKSPAEKNYKPRQFPSDREQYDMLGAIAYVEDRLEAQGRPRQVGLFGLSRGGGAAILASVGIDSVRAIVVDGAFCTDTLLESYIKRWACVFAKLRIAYENHPPTVWRFLRRLMLHCATRRFGCRYPSVRKALRRIKPTPILFIHGERDSYIPLEQAQMLYDAASEPKFLWTVPGARHNQCVVQQPEPYAERVVSFFDRFLFGCSRSPSIDPIALSDLTQPVAEVEPGLVRPARTAVSAPQPVDRRG